VEGTRYLFMFMLVLTQDHDQAFWDRTGGFWNKGTLHGKYATIFFSTASPGGGQETTSLNTLSTLVHHGIVFVPLGYKNAFPILTNIKEVHGGT
jgi:multimeric flavodoxin WrbA